MSDEKKEEKEEENKENLEIINPEETEYITSTISISIPEYENKYIGNKNVTFYRIKVIDYFKKTSWTLDKRYSEFESLYKSLQEIFSQVP